MGILKVIRHTDTNSDYLYNAIKYVMHEHTDPDYVRSPNTSIASITDAYGQMYAVKKYYDKTGGNPLFHFVVIYTPRSAYDIDRAMYLTSKIAAFYADKYQVIWCVHYKPMSKRHGTVSSMFHAHIVMNSVSYIDGRMYSDSYSERAEFLEHIKRVTGDNHWRIAYNCSNGKGYISNENAL
jgi:Relaxase/Mobilisation nuclease domain.